MTSRGLRVPVGKPKDDMASRGNLGIKGGGTAFPNTVVENGDGLESRGVTPLHKNQRGFQVGTSFLMPFCQIRDSKNSSEFSLERDNLLVEKLCQMKKSKGVVIQSAKMSNIQQKKHINSK